MLELGEVDVDPVGDIDDLPELREPVGDVVTLSDALGPGLGDPLLLHPGSAVASNAISASTTNRNLRTDHLSVWG